MEKVILLEREAFNIKLDTKNDVFIVNLIADVEYDDAGFQEFLEYFKSGWVYINTNKQVYHMFINLGSVKKKNELPLHAYIKLIKMITDINEILIKHCHSICILTEGSKKWEESYNLLTKLWNPPERRPLKFTDCEEEVDIFFKTNKLLQNNNIIR